MSKSIKILVSIIFTLLVLVGATLYFVSSKINPELIRGLAKENIEKNFPNTEVKIGEVDYQIGSNVSLLIKNIDFYLKSDKTKLLKLESLDVDIPLLAILTSGGAIEIKTSSPQIYVKQRENYLNWKVALLQKTKNIKKSDSTKETSSSTKFEVPSFIEKSKLNFRMKNLNVIYDQGVKQVSNIEISKLKIINLNFKKSTAYELALKVDYNFEENKEFKTNVQLVGEIKLKELLESNILKLSSQVKINSTSISDLDLKLPNVKGDIVLDGKVEDLKAKINFDVDNLVSLSTDVAISRSQIKLSNINTRMFMGEIAKLLKNQIGPLMNDIDVSQTEVFLSGSINYDLSEGKIKPELSFESKKNMSINLVKDMPILTKFSGKITEREITAQILNEILDGSITAKVSSKVDINSLPDEISKIPLVYTELSLSGLVISRKFIQETLYAKSKKAEKKSNPQNGEFATEKVQATKILLPKAFLKITGENIKIDSEVISLDSGIDIGGTKVSSDNTSLVYGRGNITLDFETNIFNSQDIRNNLNISFNNVLVDAFNAFFPPYLSDLKGEFRGSVKGSINLQETLKYKLNASATGKNGEMKNLNVMKFLKPTLEGIPMLKGKIPKKYNVSDKFETLQFSLIATESDNKILKLLLVGNNKDSKLDAKGNVSMIDKNSTIIGDIYVKELSNDIEQLTAQSNIPFKLSGEGFGLLPNITYTTDKLATLVARQATKKAKKDIDKKIKKKGDDLKKKLEEELKKKLKGFSL